MRSRRNWRDRDSASSLFVLHSIAYSLQPLVSSSVWCNILMVGAKVWAKLTFLLVRFHTGSLKMSLSFFFKFCYFSILTAKYIIVNIFWWPLAFPGDLSLLRSRFWSLSTYFSISLHFHISSSLLPLSLSYLSLHLSLSFLFSLTHLKVFLHSLPFLSPMLSILSLNLFSSSLSIFLSLSFFTIMSFFIHVFSPLLLKHPQI